MMNATSLYVSTMKVALTASSDDSSSVTDLCRLMPYLRQSLSCTVCGNLLVEPYTPRDTNCQHHVCNACKGGKKKLKPACSWCKDYDNYDENLLLRSQLQCYKKMCDYLITSPLYRLMSPSSGDGNIVDLIDEGSGFKDEWCNAGLSKSAYSILPCIYTHTSTQTNIPSSLSNEPYAAEEKNSIIAQNGSSLYSVMYPGSGSKMVIKRKVHEDSPIIIKNSFKRPFHRKLAKTKQMRVSKEDEKRNGRGNEKKPRIGCRCGNATSAPGKLTCCGQRCPCYVGSKACIDCKCRGCRNPHTREGQKVLREVQELKSPSEDDLDSEMLPMGLDELQLDVLELRSDSSPNDLDLL